MWYMDECNNGVRVRKPLSTDQRVALQMNRSLLVNRDKFNAGLPVDIKVQQLFDEYEKYSKGTKREKTYQKIMDGIKFLKKIVNVDMPISKVINSLPKIIDDYKADALSAGKNRFTVNNYMKTARQIFNKAVKWNYISSNPLSQIELAEVPPIPRPRFLDNEELKKILAVCTGDLYDMIIVFAYTGLRAAELMNLEWQDVNFEQNYIMVTEKDIFTPKNYERRTVPIHPDLRELLILRKSGTTSSFVFFDRSRDRKQDQIMRKVPNGRLYRSIYKKFKRRLKESGINNIDKVCIHTLRHTFGSHCVMSGIDIFTTSMLMGHSSVDTTKIYAHVSPQYMQDAIFKLDYDFLGKTKEFKLKCIK